MPVSRNRKPAKRTSRRLETRVSGPAVAVVGTGRKMLLPHERDEAAIPEPRESVAGNRRRIRQAARDVTQGLKDTEARGTPTNIPVERRPGKRGKRVSG